MFKNLEFETLPICEEGVRFSFKAEIDKSELVERINDFRFNLGFEEDFDTVAIYRGGEVVRAARTHIGTYNKKDKILYTDSREAFCQMK